MFCQFEKSSSSKFATLFFNQFASSISTSSLNQFENSNFIISKSFFISFDENNIISLWKKSTKQIINIKTNWSNFESLKITSSFLFLNRNSITALRIFAILTLFWFRDTHTTQHNFIDAFFLFLNNFFFSSTIISRSSHRDRQWKEIMWDNDFVMIETTIDKWKITERKRKKT
jgi:hypothetical protein